MFALVNYTKKIVLGSDGNFYSGLPHSMASYFCFASYEDAERMAKTVLSPKFVIIPVSIDADGFPTKVAN
jgi:hypothetical protein